MKGIELSREYYKAFGEPMLDQFFGDVKNRIAVGIVGEGSECFGYDDEISTDHDFEPGFCIWLTKADYQNFGFKLERAYAKLPKEFMGYKRSSVAPVGGARRGVMVTDDFFLKHIGLTSEPKTPEQWFYAPTTGLSSVSNGELFYDGLGEFSKIYDTLKQGYPRDVKLKKIAAHTIFMVQSGLYNYERCIRHGENGAGQLAVFEFVKHAISTIYLLNNKFQPFYKWAYRGLRGLDVLSSLEDSLIALTEMGNGEMEFLAKKESIEEICQMFIDEYRRQGLITCTINDLERQAYNIQESISDPTIRNMNIMDGI